MKRTLTILLVLCLMLSFAACGSKPSGNTPSNVPSGNEQASEPSDTELKGVIKDDAYENEYLDVRIPLPSGWVFYNEEQIAQMNGLTAEIVSGSDLAEAVKKAGQYMDLMMASGTGNSVNLIIQPMDNTITALSDKQLFNLLESNMKKQFEAAGMSLTTYETVEMNVGGEQRTVLHMVLNNAVDEYQIWYRDRGNFMGFLTLAITDGADPAPILESITSLK